MSNSIKTAKTHAVSPYRSDLTACGRVIGYTSGKRAAYQTQVAEISRYATCLRCRCSYGEEIPESMSVELFVAALKKQDAEVVEVQKRSAANAAASAAADFSADVPAVEQIGETSYNLHTTAKVAAPAAELPRERCRECAEEVTDGGHGHRADCLDYEKPLLGIAVLSDLEVALAELRVELRATVKASDEAAGAVPKAEAALDAARRKATRLMADRNLLVEQIQRLQARIQAEAFGNAPCGPLCRGGERNHEHRLCPALPEAERAPEPFIQPESFGCGFTENTGLEVGVCERCLVHRADHWRVPMAPAPRAVEHQPQTAIGMAAHIVDDEQRKGAPLDEIVERILRGELPTADDRFVAASLFGADYAGTVAGAMLAICLRRIEDAPRRRERGHAEARATLPPQFR